MAAIQEGLVSRYLNRRISRPMAAILAKTPVTPNQVSFLSFCMALGCLGLFAAGHNIWAGVAAQLSSIIDGADGDLARLKNKATPFGGYFDAVLDRYADVFILAGLAYWSWKVEDKAALWVVAGVGLAAITGAFMVSYTRARAEASMGFSFQGLAASLASRDARLLLVMIGAVAGQALLVLSVLALLTNLVVLWRVLIVRREHFSSTSSSH